MRRTDDRRSARFAVILFTAEKTINNNERYGIVTMAKTKSSLLLKVVSVIFFAWGIFFAVAQVLSLVGGKVDLGFAAYAGAVAGWVGAAVEFICGVIGLKGKNLGLGKLLALVLVALVAYNVILSVSSGFAWTQITGLVNLILPILYVIGIDKATKK